MKTEHTNRGRARSRGAVMRSERGQSLLIALAVMFILVFLGTLFIVLVSRNLTATGRSTEQNEARYLAEAGIRYADRMLTQSEEGADWRPVPDNQGALENGTGPDGTIQLIPDNGAYGWQWLKEHHPDFKWVRPYWPTEEDWRGPTGGYTTVDSGEGRFLIRVTYEPKKVQAGSGFAYDPVSKYIRIESIGRTGDLRDLYMCPVESSRPDGYRSSKPGKCPNDGAVLEPDPTVVTGLKTSLKSELMAYKPICLTDYARFITNKEKRPVTADLGCPGFATQYGYYISPNDYRGSPIRVNGNLRWNGSGEGLSDDRSRPVTIYLSGYTYDRYDEDSQRYYTSEVPTDTVEVSGDIDHEEDGNQGPIKVFVRKIIDGAVGAPQEVFRSRDAFTTLGGFYRDGRDETEGPFPGTPFTYTRGVRRIEPPDITEPDPATGLSRYRNLTAYSGDWYLDPNGSRYRRGQIGWGRGIYINNPNDVQRESEGIFGGYTVVKDWMNPNNFMLSYWQGPYYVPPGVLITLNPDDTDGDGQPDITITRTDVGQNRRGRYVWRDILGRPREIWGETITVPYPTPFRKVREPNPDPSRPDTGPATIPLPGNGVIFAEGNIRIKGMLPKSHRADPNDPNSPWVRYNLTIVSGGNIYIEGSVLKNRSADNQGNIVTDHSGSVALLASEYVCVNTTQFVSMLPSGAPLPQGSDAMNGEPPYHLVIGTSSSASFRSSFTLGPWDALDNPSAWNGSIYAFVRHAGQYGPAYINLLVNPGYPDMRYGVYNFGIRPPVPPNVYGVGDPL